MVQEEEKQREGEEEVVVGMCALDGNVRLGGWRDSTGLDR